MKDFETCEHCYGQSPDVRLRHDPVNEGYHVWTCDACDEEQREMADLMNEGSDL